MPSKATTLFCLIYVAFTGFLVGYIMDKVHSEDTP